MTLHLVSDLDGTWLPAPGRRGDLEQLEAFLGRNPGILLTFATGRTLASALAVLGSLGAMPPRYLVTDVGTAIFEREAAGRWVELEAYAQWVEHRWDGPGVAALLGALPESVVRQASVAPCRRLALETAPGAELGPAAAALAQRLTAAGLEAEVLASGDRCLDVLPRGVHKGSAIQYLQTCRLVPGLLVACGDSENDAALLRLADVPVLMAGGSLKLEALGLPRQRLACPTEPGPLGILEALRALGAPS